MLQPTSREITQRLEQILNNQLSREEVADWAFAFLEQDDALAEMDLNAWHYLVTVSAVAERTAPGEYLYSLEDIQDWIEEHAGH